MLKRFHFFRNKDTPTPSQHDLGYALDAAVEANEHDDIVALLRDGADIRFSHYQALRKSVDQGKTESASLLFRHFIQEAPDMPEMEYILKELAQLVRRPVQCVAFNSLCVLCLDTDYQAAAQACLATRINMALHSISLYSRIAFFQSEFSYDSWPEDMLVDNQVVLFRDYFSRQKSTPLDALSQCPPHLKTALLKMISHEKSQQ